MFPSLSPSLAYLQRDLWPPSSSSSSVPPSSLFSQEELEEIQHTVEDLEEVQKIWKSIGAVLADAAERQIREASVHMWLRELKDLAYKIEDLRDECEYEEVARQVQSSSTPTWWMRLYKFLFQVRPSVTNPSLPPVADASFRKNIAADVGRIKEAFESIAKQRETLHLKESDGSKYFFDEGAAERQPTDRLVVDPIFLGRDRERQKLRALLIDGHGGGTMSVEVIAVIGMGGIGKTSLAQHICEDLAGNFDKIGWVHVSEDFDVTRLAKAIVEAFSGADTPLNVLSSLQNEALRLIKDKKVLLVMDDIWSFNRAGWESLIAPFGHGAGEGSKILVTTRFQRVAEELRVVGSIKLGFLSQEDGWSLLKKLALPNQIDDVIGNLEEIGRGIARKCGGLPLSLKLLGGLLRCKGNDENEWRSVLESDLLDFDEGSEAKEEILGSLYLSYLYLPPTLKSCFKFCASHPNDFIPEKSLISSWMVYDLVSNEKEAAKCLRELESRFFLETKGPGVFRMHDHIYEVAKYALGEERVNLEHDGKSPQQLGESHFAGAKHASITFHKADSRCHINTSVPNLRTLKLFVSRESHDRRLVSPEVHLSPGRCLRELHIELPFEREKIFFMELASFDGCRDQLKCLRVLTFCDVWGSAPAWVSQLYNLRYLNLRSLDRDCSLDFVCDLRNLRWLIVDDCGICCLPEAISRLTNLQELSLERSKRIKSLPKSISELDNLQELNLFDCQGLTELPEGIVRLTNLRILNLQFSGISWMPGGIGALTKLEHLTYYVSSEHAGLAELKKMRNLKHVEIVNLCDKVTEEDAAQAQLATKKCIRLLHLHWVEYADEGCLDREKIVRCLRPHRDIEKLSIKNYRASALPLWLGDESFTKLVDLHLQSINYCTSLSPIDRLPCLDTLVLWIMDSLKEVFPYRSNIGHDIGIMHPAITEHRQFFPKLRRLTIQHCKSLKFLPLHKFSSLVYVRVNGCSNLRSMEPPYGIPCCLNVIDISGCPKFQFSLDPHFPRPSWKLNYKT